MISNVCTLECPSKNAYEIICIARWCTVLRRDRVSLWAMSTYQWGVSMRGRCLIVLPLVTVAVIFFLFPEPADSQCYSCTGGGTYGWSTFCDAGAAEGTTSCWEVSSGGVTDCYLGGSVCVTKPPIQQVVSADLVPDLDSTTEAGIPSRQYCLAQIGSTESDFHSPGLQSTSTSSPSLSARHP